MPIDAIALDKALYWFLCERSAQMGESYTSDMHEAAKLEDQYCISDIRVQLKCAIKAYEAAKTATKDQPITVGDDAMHHLGNLLYMLAGLHPDDQTAAYEEALAFYNAACPDKQVHSEDGFVWRLVLETPLDRATKDQPDDFTEVNIDDHDPEGDAYANGYADGYKAKAIETERQAAQPDDCTITNLHEMIYDIHQHRTDRPLNDYMADIVALFWQPMRESRTPPPDMGMRMADVRVGMKLKSLYGGPIITVSELTEKGFKYTHPPYHLGARIGQTSGGEHFGCNGYSHYTRPGDPKP